LAVLDDKALGEGDDRLRRVCRDRVEGAIKLRSVGRRQEGETNAELFRLRRKISPLALFAGMERIGDDRDTANVGPYLM